MVSSRAAVRRAARDPDRRHRPHRLPARARRESARLERQPDDGARLPGPPARGSASAAAASSSSTRAAARPRRSPTSTSSIRPGADACLLFALVHVLFDEGLVRLGRLADVHERRRARARGSRATSRPRRSRTRLRRRAADASARSRASSPRRRAPPCYGRIGTCTQEFGTLASWLVDVLNVLTGNLDRPGGALFPRPAHGPAEDRPRKPARVPYARWRSRVRGLPEFAGELPAAALAEEIDAAGDARDPRARHGRAATPCSRRRTARASSSALEALDFMVSVDIYLNETTRFARRDPADHAAARARQLRPRVPRASRCGTTRSGRRRRSPKPAGRDATAGRCSLELAARVHGADADAVARADPRAASSARRSARPGTACPETQRGRSAREARRRARPRAPRRPDAARRPVRRPLRRRGRRASRSRSSRRPSTASTSARSRRGCPAMLATESGADRARARAARRRRRAPARRARERARRRLRADRPPPPALEQLVDAQPAGAREGQGALHAARAPRRRARARARRRRPRARALARRRGRGAGRAQRRR